MDQSQLQPNAKTPRPVALVTGASRGIGAELARVLARHGHELVLLARSSAELEALSVALHSTYNVHAEILPADLSDPETPSRVFESLAQRGIAVDVLINNAGFGLAGRFDRTDVERDLDMIQVNVAALTALTRLFLPGMIDRGHGRVMNVASTAAFQPGPFNAVYYATKAFVLSFSVAIAEELRETGVTITALCPGPTRTAFATVANMKHSRRFNSSLTMSADRVADYGYRAMLLGKRVAIPGVLNRLVAFSNRLAPRTLVTRISRLAQEHR
jgi:short-subunit dehydrogenase